MGAGGWNLEIGIGSHLAGTDEQRRRRPETEQSELLEATAIGRRRDGEVIDALTATEVQPSKRKSQILDQQLSIRGWNVGSTTVSSLPPFFVS